ncbi:unnamed protein product [Rhizoctonia solani]|uniref:JmjC domain-containing protein n=1 Tax=Rhizoctonia solani TaxID=456999 RepID=A0A8H3ALE7_9AGAM|nr:unnamed protein product [Rhizoctonia solani]
MTLTQTTLASLKRSNSVQENSSSKLAHKLPRRDSNTDCTSKQTSHLHSGIKPSGNLLFNPSLSIRQRGLGALDAFSDALLLGIIGLLTPKDILLLGSCSKALFAYCAHQPIWKDLFVRAANGKLDGWAGTWRKTYLQEFTPTGSPRRNVGRYMRPTPVVDCTGLFSDELYQPYLCANTDVSRYFYPQSLREGASRLNMKRVEAESIAHEFAALSAEPFIVTNALSHLEWPAFCCVDSRGEPIWELSNLLQKYSNVSFRAEAFDCTLQTYCAYAENCAEDDAPLYLFDSRFVEKTRMGMDYTPPSFLSEDLFQLMGEKRPDYRWLIVGPAKSGSTFHKDPNATSAWNAVITGSKGIVFQFFIRIILLTPFLWKAGLCFHQIYALQESMFLRMKQRLRLHSHSRPQQEWFMSYFDGAWSEYGRGTGKMRIGVCRAGEVVYVPSGWWHLVVNLEPSVAVTQNFASEHELTNVLQFMRDKPDQTSGWSEDIACNDLYEIFCDVLRKERPEVLERALAALNKAPRKSSGEQQYVWDQVKKSTESEGNCGFSFGFDVEGGDEEE